MTASADADFEESVELQKIFEFFFPNVGERDAASSRWPRSCSVDAEYSRLTHRRLTEATRLNPKEADSSLVALRQPQGVLGSDDAMGERGSPSTLQNARPEKLQSPR